MFWFFALSMVFGVFLAIIIANTVQYFIELRNDIKRIRQILESVYNRKQGAQYFEYDEVTK